MMVIIMIFIITIRRTIPIIAPIIIGSWEVSDLGALEADGITEDVVVWLTDRIADWLVDGVVDNPLVDGVVDNPLVDRVVDKSVDWIVDWLVNKLVKSLVDWVLDPVKW